DRRCREVYGSSSLGRGFPRQVLPDGYGRAAADGLCGGHGSRRVYPFCYDIFSVRDTSCLRFHPSSNRRRTPERENGMCTSGSYVWLWAEPPDRKSVV